MSFFRLSWRLPVIVASIVVTALLMAAPRTAAAQTLAISMGGIARQVSLRSDPTGRFKVSRADCLANDVISFPLVVGDYAGSSLEVWATASTSDDCRTDTARTTATATCWRVYQATPSSTTVTVPIRVQDIAAHPAGGTDGTDAGTAASCDSTIATGQPVTLWFMFLQGTTQVGTAQSWPTTIDLLGPAPPVVGSLGSGSGLVKLSWTANTDPDVVAYRLFCEDLGATSGGVTTYEAGAPGPEPVPEAGPSVTCPDADNGTTDDAGDGSDDAGTTTNDAGCTTGTGGSGGSGGTGATDGGGGSVVTAGCSPTFLAEGLVLTPDLVARLSCGSLTGARATEGLVTGLTNFNKYAVAVAASDLVENVGALSAVQCDTPQPVNGFDEVYRSAGGKAGGTSFCSLGARSGAARTKLWPGAVFFGIIALRRWRRRSAERSRKATLR